VIPSREEDRAPGEIVLEGVSRSFSMRADHGRTLKERFIDRRRHTGPAPIEALRDVSLQISPGETVGLIGRNGAGKSSTLRVLAGIVPPDRGRVRGGGRIVTLLELGAGFSRDFTGRENIYLNGALHGLSKAQIEERIDPIIAFADLGDFIEAPVRTYSSGMFVRLGFAIAAYLDADVLLIDEVLAVGDEAFQRKCMRRIAERISEGTTLVLVSHAAEAIERICQRVAVLDAGRVVFDGPSPEGLLFYHRLMGTERADSTTVPRIGQAALEIAEVELQDEAGRRSHVFGTGEQLRVALTLRAAMPVARALLELEVRDYEGRRLFATQIAPAMGNGTARLVFAVSRLGLLGGDYEVALSARDADRSDAPTFDRLIGFGVADEPGVEGMLDLRGMWTVTEPAEAGDGRAVAFDELSTKPPPPLRLTANKAIVRDFYDRTINGRDASACEQLLTADFRYNGTQLGSIGQRQVVQVLLDAFSPLHHRILTIFGENDLVCAHQRWWGKHAGDFVGHAATGREVSFTAITIHKIHDGQIREVWDRLDTAELLAQLT